MKLCKKCGETDVTKFQSHSTRTCKRCQNKARRVRLALKKLKMIEYKGGKCERCHYDKCQDALDFHHNNPKEKDINYWQKVKWQDLETIFKELDKCTLLCKNCHAEVHWEIHRKGKRNEKS